MVGTCSAVLALGACSSGDDATGAATTDDGDGTGGVSVEVTEGERVEVLGLDNLFRPEELKVRAGTEVVWRNRGQVDHDVIPEEDAYGFLAETEDFEPGEEYRFTFDEPGVYRYYCSLHGTVDAGMKGVIEVVPEGRG